MRFLSFFFLLYVPAVLYSQKPALDTNSIKNWPSLYEPALSPDGEYLSYTINRAQSERSTLVIHATQNSWELQIPSGKNLSYSSNGRFIIFEKEGDTLCIARLGKGIIKEIPDAIQYKMVPRRQQDYLCYINKQTQASNLVSLNGLNIKTISNTVGFQVHPDGTYIFFERAMPMGTDTVLVLEQFTIANQSFKRVHSVKIIDGKRPGFSLAFFGHSNYIILSLNTSEITANVSSIWLYDLKRNKIVKVIKETFEVEGCQFKTLQFPPVINKEETLISFWAQAIDVNPKQNTSRSAIVDIWKTTDHSFIRRYNHAEGNIPTAAPQLLSYDISTKKMFVVNKSGEEITLPADANIYNIALVKQSTGDFNELNWNPASAATFSMVSLKDGSRTELLKGVKKFINYPGLSPTGKWAIYFNSEDSNYYSLETITNIRRNITKNIKTDWFVEENDMPRQFLNWLPWHPTWIGNDSLVLIYDNFDIWLVDPRNKQAPCNITAGYGKDKNIKFQVVEQRQDLNDMKISLNTDVLLTAFNKKTKDNGFFRSSIVGKSIPKQLTMGPYVYYWKTNDLDMPLVPLKSAIGKSYLVQRMNEKEAPNYFLTKNFQSFKRITNINPHKDFNWLNTELVEWKTLDGVSSQGILFKPENFDPRKKYPVIFTFYERLSDRLHEYLYPQLTEGPLNVPWFVSHGYIVFLPDIHYKIGDPGQSAVNAVVSAAKTLSGFPYIDSTKMGLYGHSWGGYQVNFTITKTNLFATAVEFAGPSDFISSYGLVSHNGRTRGWLYELEQSRMGHTLWERRDLYIKNSPIFYADQITTPLLIIHNRDDDQVPWSEGVELFNALRRLNKRAWMLQYKSAGHTIVVREHVLDFSEKLLSYFDYYLKGKSLPGWMREE